jgi:hypothetical protein
LLKETVLPGLLGLDKRLKANPYSNPRLGPAPAEPRKYTNEEKLDIMTNVRMGHMTVQEAMAIIEAGTTVPLPGSEEEEKQKQEEEERRKKSAAEEKDEDDRADWDTLLKDAEDTAYLDAYLENMSGETVQNIQQQFETKAVVKALAFMAPFTRTAQEREDQVTIIEGSLMACGVKKSSNTQAPANYFFKLTATYLRITKIGDPKNVMYLDTKKIKIVNMECGVKQSEGLDMGSIDILDAKWPALNGLQMYIMEHPYSFQIHSEEMSFVCSAADQTKKTQWMRVLSFVASEARLSVGKVGGGLFGVSMDLLANVYESDFPCFSTATDEKAADGKALDWSAIQVRNRRLSTTFRAPIMNPKDAATQCHASDCNKKFGMFTRKHHCTTCGKVFCDACCTSRNCPAEVLEAYPLELTDRMCKPCVEGLRRRSHNQKVMMLKLVSDRKRNQI